MVISYFKNNNSVVLVEVMLNKYWFLHELTFNIVLIIDIEAHCTLLVLYTCTQHTKKVWCVSDYKEMNRYILSMYRSNE